MVMAWLGNPRRISTGLGAQFYGVFPPSKVVMGESGRMQDYRLSTYNIPWHGNILSRMRMLAESAWA